MKKTKKGKSTTKSSSSGQTVQSTMQKEVLDLGRALVEELDLEQSVDTLGRWMAHHLAEMIQSAESANVEDRSDKMARCADAVLTLWEHRHLLPSGKRPFEDMEPILRTLQSLDPEDDTPRYFRSTRSSVNENELDTETKKWLELIDGLDYSAKILIRYCYTQAAQTTLDKSKKWVALAEACGIDEGIEYPVIRFIDGENDLINGDEQDNRALKELEERVKRLDAFNKMSVALTIKLRKQLNRS